MPLLPSALPPKGEARRYVANDFLNLIALPLEGKADDTGIPSSKMRRSRHLNLLNLLNPHTAGMSKGKKPK